ncbi:hypothetical protein Bca4012_074414 [Brassica carinata]|uniref:DUF547 domain-containing protein n=4 Tax=Brassica TaxID=3705 RepID=A0A0D3CKQ9_BRAOL|nr:PREDICTED: uncharacterized protein LOC106343983 isoform X1 [Brassica oleracea var. oleracea]CAF1935066.1 unnamed protein product [Brassica napus]CDY23560.1 BnaC05g40340D [Brassica napus]VDD46613.1 unnamed protein product [Brassica oleracea]
MVITTKLQILRMFDSQVLKSNSGGIERCQESTSGESFLYRYQLEEDVKRLQLQLQEEIELHTFLESVMEKDPWQLSSSSCSVPHQAQELLSNISTLETAVTKLEQEMMSLNFQLSQERNERRLAEYHLTHSASPPNISSSLIYLNHSDSELHRSAEDSSCQNQDSSSESSQAESTVKKSNQILEKRLMRKTNGRKLLKYLWDHPNLLSEEMVRCMKNIFMSLADQTKASSNESQLLSPVASPRGHLSSSSSWWPSTERSKISSWVQSPQIDIQSNNNVLAATGNVFDPYKVRGKLSWAEIGNYGLASEVSWMSVGKKQLEYASGALRRFRTLVEQLARVNPIHLSCDEKLAFWINVYNALIMHAYLAYGVPKSDLKLFSLMQKAAYTVGGHSYTAAAMEYVILKMKPPTHRPQIALLLAINKVKVSEEQRKASIDRHEPLLSFALSCGMYSSPAVRIYTAKRVKEELQEAQREFIQASVGLSSKGKLLVPKMLHCYAKSLVEDSNLGVWISKYLPPHQAAFVEQCISQRRRQSLLSSRNCGILPFDSRFRYLFLPDNNNNSCV